MVRSGRAAVAPFAVGAYIGAAYFFTSSTSFANPAVTLARTLSNTFAGIAPGSVAAFVVAQVVGAALAVGAVRSSIRRGRRGDVVCRTGRAPTQDGCRARRPGG